MSVQSAARSQNRRRGRLGGAARGRLGPRLTPAIDRELWRLSGLEAALDRSAVPFDLDQDPGPGRAPGREEAKLAVGDGVADQEAPHPQAKEAVAILGSLEVGQLKMG